MRIVPDVSPRLAGVMSRRPLRVGIAALLISALGLLGVLRFGVDAGQSLLVGRTSTAAQTYDSFSNSFGADPIVLVFTAHNPTALYVERNLQRLGALEIDLAHDPRVASVLGPGTIAGSLRQAAVSEVGRVLTEYPYFVAETDYLAQIQKGNTNQQQLQQQLQKDIQSATALLELYVVRAASDAHNARAQYKPTPADLYIDSREKAVDAAVAKDPLPPLWAEYLAGPAQSPNEAAARQFFARVAAAYGDCDDTIASLLKIQPSCQIFFERTLLDLPHCPAVSAHLPCDPKPQWAGVLPPAQPGGDSIAITTIRIKPQYVGDQAAMRGLQDKINAELDHGIATDDYTHSLSAASLKNLKDLGPLAPTECGGASATDNAACNSSFHDAQMTRVIAGAPLLGLGVVSSMSQLLLILSLVALFVMLLILVGTFRVRGRWTPLVAATAATVLTVGISLLIGTPITPAVLAGIPVLVGLGVDYAVQLIARFSEERASGTDVEDALRRVLSNTGNTTLVAAAATLAGLAALAVFGGIDWGPLVAVPLVAEFALVLCGGVVLAWLGAVFVALPFAVWSDARRPRDTERAVEREASARPPAQRTLAIADNWKGITALATVLSLAGWVLLRAVPVQTDVQALLAPSLKELSNLQLVQAETGYTNEIDVYIRGPVATGPINTQTGNPANVEWQCGAAATIRATHADSVAQATSIGDYVIAAGSSSSGSATGAQCVPAAPSPSASPSASPSPQASGSPRASASATRARSAPGHAVLAAATPTTAASPTPAASSAASPSPAASATPAPSGSNGSSPATQTRFLCDLRLFPELSRTLVMPISTDTQPCPAVDEYQQIFVRADTTPITPTSSRIAIGVHTASVAQQAQLVHSLAQDVSSAPNGMTATPTGLAVLATTAYDNLVGRSYLLNLAPLLIVALALIAIYRQPRRALLPLVPTILAAGWGPLVLLALGRLPGSLGTTLGSLNPLTVVLGALVVALGTEFGVVLLGRFYEERARGLDPDAAAAVALAGVGRAIRVSALTLGAGFAVLALSGLLPNGLPLVADFGFAVVIDLALAVAAVFLVMLPLAVALERHSPLLLAAPADALAAAPARTPSAAPATKPAPRRPRAQPAETEPPASEPPRRAPGVSGRRRKPAATETPEAPETGPEHPPRRPGVSGRRRRR